MANSAQKSRRLGKGLSALMQPGAAVEVPIQETAVSGTRPGEDSIRRINVASIVPSPFQPRTSFGEEELAQLAQSIRSAGLIQPILVRQTEQSTSFELVAGERRWRAAAAAGLEEVPAIVVVLSDEDAAEWALIENLQRKDLNAMERAHALRRLCERFELTHQQVAERVGLERPTVANLIRITELAEPIQDLIASGDLTVGHGKALLSIADPERRLRVARQAAAERWTVRQVEQHNKPTILSEGDGTARVASPTLADLERRLSEHLGTRVRIATTRDGTRGRITVEFYSLDHFDGLMNMLGFNDSEL